MTFFKVLATMPSLDTVLPVSQLQSLKWPGLNSSWPVLGALYREIESGVRTTRGANEPAPQPILWIVNVLAQDFISKNQGSWDAITGDDDLWEGVPLEIQYDLQCAFLLHLQLQCLEDSWYSNKEICSVMSQALSDAHRERMTAVLEEFRQARRDVCSAIFFITERVSPDNMEGIWGSSGVFEDLLEEIDYLGSGAFQSDMADELIVTKKEDLTLREFQWRVQGEFVLELRDLQTLLIDFYDSFCSRNESDNAFNDCLRRLSNWLSAKEFAGLHSQLGATAEEGCHVDEALYQLLSRLLPHMESIFDIFSDNWYKSTFGYEHRSAYQRFRDERAVLENVFLTQLGKERAVLGKAVITVLRRMSKRYYKTLEKLGAKHSYLGTKEHAQYAQHFVRGVTAQRREDAKQLCDEIQKEHDLIRDMELSFLASPLKAQLLRTLFETLSSVVYKLFNELVRPSGMDCYFEILRKLPQFQSKLLCLVVKDPKGQLGALAGGVGVERDSRLFVAGKRKIGDSEDALVKGV